MTVIIEQNIQNFYNGAQSKDFFLKKKKWTERMDLVLFTVKNYKSEGRNYVQYKNSNNK